MDFSSNDGLEIRARVVVIAVGQGIERRKEGRKEEKKGEEERHGCNGRKCWR